MAEIDHVTEVETRFRDLDTNGHVNNAVYVSYTEQARAEYFADVVGTALADAEIALAQLTVEFTAPISLGDTVTVQTRVPRLGDSSFPMEHDITADGRPAASASATIVPLAPDGESPREIPETWRDAIHSHESLGE